MSDWYNLKLYALCYALRIIDFCLSNSQVLFFSLLKQFPEQRSKWWKSLEFPFSMYALDRKLKWKHCQHMQIAVKNRQRWIKIRLGQKRLDPYLANFNVHFRFGLNFFYRWWTRIFCHIIISSFINGVTPFLLSSY